MSGFDYSIKCIFCDDFFLTTRVDDELFVVGEVVFDDFPVGVGGGLSFGIGVGKESAEAVVGPRGDVGSCFGFHFFADDVVVGVVEEFFLLKELTVVVEGLGFCEPAS